MADRISEERRSYNMRRIRSTGTQIELTARRLVWDLGYRYRLHDRSLPGKPDMVFRGRRKAVFVHGCFWHQHPSRDCLDSRVPSSREGYWSPKLARNVQRDAENAAALEAMGWGVLVVWGCEVERSPAAVRDRVREFMEADA